MCVLVSAKWGHGLDFKMCMRVWGVGCLKLDPKLPTAGLTGPGHEMTFSTNLQKLQIWPKSLCVEDIIKPCSNKKRVNHGCHLTLKRKGSQPKRGINKYLWPLQQQELWTACISSCPSLQWKFPCCRHCPPCHSGGGKMPGSLADTSCSPPVAIKVIKRELQEETGGQLRGRFSYFVFGLQRHRVNHADVVGFGSGVKVVSIFDEIAGTIVCEVRDGVVEKGNGPTKQTSNVNTGGEESGNTAGTQFYHKHRYNNE